MLDKLLALISSETPFWHLKEILEATEHLMANFTEEYVKDKDAKNAAIDVLIEIIQSYKDK